MENKEYKYKFSIIMSIYNVEEYLEEAIDSILRQTIGFEENVQLILVNDGSEDNSEEICLKYKEQYPNNIVYVKKENGGVASAKNLGLTYREGKYINFCDPDDKLRRNTLKEVFDFFEINYNTIPYVVIPLYMFEAQEGLHGKYAWLGNRNRIINLDSEPYNFTLSTASAFYKTELFDEIHFDETLLMSEDAMVNFQILDKYHCFGYVAENKVKYFYRKRLASDSIIDSYAENKDNFYIVLKIWNEITKNGTKVSKYMKEFFLYEVRSRLREISSDIFEDYSEYEEIINQYKKIIKQIGVDHIANVSRMIPSKNAKYIFLSDVLENKPFELGMNGFFQKDGYNIFPVSNLEAQLRGFYYLKDKIRFEFLFWDYNCEEIELIVRDKKGKEINWKEEQEISCPYDQKYGEFIICPTKRFILEIPYKKIKISLFIRNRINGLEYQLKKINIPKKSKFELQDTEIRLFHGGFNMKYNTYELTLKKFKYSGIKYNFHTYKHIKKNYKYKAKLRLLNRRKKKYILINDRPQKAGDNGEAIFKYINKNEKQLAKKTYYVISKDCEDYKRLKKYGKVVKLNSFKHRFLYLNSKAILSSHTHPLFFNAFDLDHLKYYQDMFNYKFVWLQHGIIEKDVCEGANIYKAGYDYMVVSTEKEREEVSQEKYLVYDKDKIVLNGLPRYDYLENKPENIITIAPTWRAFLSGAISNTGYHEVKAGFEESDYFKNYSAILKSEEVYKLLKDNNYVLNFLLHPGMAGYEKYFEQFQNDRIRIIDAKDINYSEVFKKSKLLITDFSSVAFDFAYLKKPVIYFQFDKEQFFSKHYKKGCFDYEVDGLGKVTYTDEETINKIKYYFENNFQMEEEYVDRVNNTYKYIDKNNCKRLVDFLKNKKVLR